MESHNTERRVSAFPEGNGRFWPHPLRSTCVGPSLWPGTIRQKLKKSCKFCMYLTQAKQDFSHESWSIRTLPVSRLCMVTALRDDLPGFRTSYGDSPHFI